MARKYESEESYPELSDNLFENWLSGAAKGFTTIEEIPEWMGHLANFTVGLKRPTMPLAPVTGLFTHSNRLWQREYERRRATNAVL
jgi:hypothetical protein